MDIKRALKDFSPLSFLAMGITCFQSILITGENFSSSPLYLAMTPLFLLALVLFILLINKNLTLGLKLIFSFLIICLSIFQMKLLLPSSFLAHLSPYVIFLLFFTFHLMDKNMLSDTRYNLLNLFPLFFFYKFFWSPNHPFSLWVIFTFLNLTAIVRPLFRDNKELTAYELFATEKISHLFLAILLILKLNN